MKALVKKFPKKGLWLEDIPEPTIEENDVLIKIEKTAICGTDIHIYNWDEWAQGIVPVPIQTGHEFVGKVVQIGKAVAGLKESMRVSGEGHVVCGHCRNCRAGKRHMCADHKSIGITLPGVFAEYLKMPAVNVFPIPHGVTDDEAAILDPLGNAVHTALTYDLVGEDVLITGAGPIGIMAGAVAKHVGARHVVILDINDYRLELAKKIGIPTCVNPTKRKLETVMEELHMTEGFDVGLEMSGASAAFNGMLDAMVNGGRIAILGFLPPETELDWNNVILKGLTLKGIYGREMFETWYKMTAMLQRGLDVDPVITHRLPVSQFEEGFRIMGEGKSGKIILDWTQV